MTLITDWFCLNTKNCGPNQMTSFCNMFLPKCIARWFLIFISVLQIVTISSSVVTDFPENQTLTSTFFTPVQAGLQNKTLGDTVPNFGECLLISWAIFLGISFSVVMIYITTMSTDEGINSSNFMVKTLPQQPSCFHLRIAVSFCDTTVYHLQNKLESLRFNIVMSSICWCDCGQHTLDHEYPCLLLQHHITLEGRRRRGTILKYTCMYLLNERTLLLGRSIIEQLVTSFTGFNFTKQENMLVFECSKVIGIILHPMVSVIWFDTFYSSPLIYLGLNA